MIRRFLIVKIFTLMVICGVGFLSFTSSGGQILFQDNFDKGNAKKWKPLHGRWIGLTDKEVYRQAVGGKDRLGQSFIPQLTVTDFSITLKLRFIGGNSQKGYGAGLRLRSNLTEKEKENKVYTIGLGTGKIGGVHVIKKITVKGKSQHQTLFSDEYPPVKFEQWYELRVKMKGAKITVWVDGKQVAELEDKDNPFLSGAVGVFSYGAAIEVDNIIIEEE
jgi:hypothetical protein